MPDLSLTLITGLAALFIAATFSANYWRHRFYTIKKELEEQYV